MTTQHGSVDVTGRPTLKVVLALPPSTTSALLVRDIPAPRQVILTMREATFRERQKFMQEKDTVGEADPIGWSAGLLRSRCEDDVPLAVFEELVMDMTESTLALLQDAYLSGRLADPKVMGGAVRTVRNRLMDAMLAGLQTEPSPSSPTTASGPGSEGS